jgi:RHS repeat-associated protein
VQLRNKKISRYIWDGNVLLPEWSYDVDDEPKIFVDDEGSVVVEKKGVENVVTWVYEKDSYVPCAKIVDGQKFSIISDYLGRPVQSFDDNGEIIWSTEYDIYGNLENLKGQKNFIPFRQLGQYEDEELDGLLYNRFRYYDSEQGNYISKDPIDLLGNNPNDYGYSTDVNKEINIFGLTTYMVGDKPMGAWGERVAARYLKSQGHSVLGSVQNASGHGFDLVTKTSDGNIHVIEVKTSGLNLAGKPNMSTWVNNNINKISGNTNGRWGNMPNYQTDLIDIISDAKANGKLKNKLVQINVNRRSIKMTCK